MAAWRGWYHISGTTYGTWLPGDPRGWRSRHHKRHVEGDHLHPPPEGAYDALANYSANQMRRPAVRLTPEQRRIGATAIVQMLQALSVEVLAVSLGEAHFHGLARFVDAEPRPLVGRAKKHAVFALKDAGHPGIHWTRGNHPKPIRSRRHQLEVFNYIVSHRQEGAFVWTCRDPPPPRLELKH